MERANLIQESLVYRDNLVLSGKKLILENPDKLNLEEIQSLSAKVLNEINSIDRSLGNTSNDSYLALPENINLQEQEELFIDFIDWYQVVQTHNNAIYKYIIENYPIMAYPRIVCVGDGKNSHLGRKLSKYGYAVISVDPVARKIFIEDNQNNKEGNFRILNATFSKDSQNLINWASIIVGSKVPECIEDFISIEKPAIFTINSNPEKDNIFFKGIKINSEEQLKNLILKCDGIRNKIVKDNISGREITIFISEGKKKENFFRDDEK